MSTKEKWRGKATREKRLLRSAAARREGKKEKFDDLMSDENKLVKLLEKNGNLAREVAEKKMEIIRKQVGLV